MSLVLVVEDNTANMELVTALLDEEGHTVIPARDGAAGLSLANERLPDIILMDISLPLINGLDATTILKREGRTRDIPIIALTAHAMRGDRERCLQAGCNDYETKPLNGPRLMEKIEQHISARSADFVRLLEQTRENEAREPLVFPLVEQLTARAEAAEHRAAELAEMIAEQEAAYKSQRAKDQADFDERLDFLKQKISESITRSRSQISELEQERDALLGTQRLAAEKLQAVIAERDQLQAAAAAAAAAPVVDTGRIEALEAAQEAREAAHRTEVAALSASHRAELSALQEAHQAELSALQEELDSAQRKSTRTRKLSSEKRLEEAEASLVLLKERETSLLNELHTLKQRQLETPVDVRLLQAELKRQGQQLLRARSALMRLQETLRDAVDASYREMMFEDPASKVSMES